VNGRRALKRFLGDFRFVPVTEVAGAATWSLVGEEHRALARIVLAIQASGHAEVHADMLGFLRRYKSALAGTAPCSGHCGMAGDANDIERAVQKERDLRDEVLRSRVEHAVAEERNRVVRYLLQRAEQYPTDIFLPDSTSPDAIAARALRKMLGVWAADIRAGRHAVTEEV
jgi:hypothetical protein